MTSGAAIALLMVLIAVPASAQPGFTILAETTQLEASAASRSRGRVIYRIKRQRTREAAQPIEPPAPTSVTTVRIIALHCHEGSATFGEMWCHRIDRANITADAGRLRLLFHAYTWPEAFRR